MQVFINRYREIPAPITPEDSGNSIVNEIAKKAKERGNLAYQNRKYNQAITEYNTAISVYAQEY